MDDSEEIDILGDFDYKQSAPSVEEDLELPSRSVQLLPEFSQHPWLLDQSWTLDHCTDEKSRAAIEKMLIEEQQYIDGQSKRNSGKKTLPSDPVVASVSLKQQSGQRKTSWTEDERSLFFQGFQLYGRRWAKIAELIPSKTHQQVKNYAYHLRPKKPATGDREELCTPPQSLADSLKLVSTAQPTTTVTCSATTSSSPAKSVTVKAVSKHTAIHGLELDDSEIVHIRHKSDTESDTDIDIELDSGDECERSTATKPNMSEQLASQESVHDGSPGDSGQELNDPSGTPASRVAISTDGVTTDETVGDNFTKQNTNCPAEETLSLHGSGVLGGDEIKAGSPSMSDSSTTLDGTKLPVILEPAPVVKTCMKGRESDRDPLCLVGEEPAGGGERDDCDEQREGDTLGECSTEDEVDEHVDEFGLLTCDNKIVYLPNPVCEQTLTSDEISGEERCLHTEFFTGNLSTKTPQRYLKIRNHVIDCWKKVKPNYLNKTSVRNGLKNCGDVNSIGRVHAYLEQIGVINFGCDQVQYKTERQMLIRPVRDRTVTHTATDRQQRINSMRPRKRRVRDETGSWVDPKLLEGKTIQHVDSVEREKPPTKQRTMRSLYDPFQLIPCRKYTQQHPAPFTVSLSTSALVVMDTHSHLSKTEVIGLLGGHYDREGSRMTVLTAVPCDSISTGMQCEMDAVSQTDACEKIEGVGESVIGWYHSHPMFEANPSVRDMETQTNFQDWFSSGGGAFIGIIVSPYNRQCASLCSDLRCLRVEKNTDQSMYLYYIHINYTVMLPVWIRW